MKSILVTNTGDRVHAKALAARQDLHVTFVTEERFVSMYAPNTDIIIVKNLNNPTESANEVLAQRDCNMYEAVLALSERAAPTAAYLRGCLGLEGPSFDTVMNCTNKFAMKRQFEKAGMPTAAFSLASSVQEVLTSGNSVGWPIIVKPVLGGGTDATKVFFSEYELFSVEGKEYFERLHNPLTTSEKEFPVIVEKFQKVTAELHCDGFIENGEVIFVQVSQYLKPVLEYTSGGIYGSFTLDHNDPVAKEVAKMHEKAAKAVGISNGVTHFEVFLTEDGLLAGEIACRPGGGGIRKMLRFMNGFDSWDAHIAVSLGENYSFKTISGSKEQLAELMLPVKRGKIKSVSAADDFESLPGLLEVEMRVKSGDVIEGLLDSSAISGILFVKLSESNTIQKVIESVENIFSIEVDNLVYSNTQ
ncbi:ATP-grasp domain-containing protein [Mesobacillus subterraneus]|uniref:ATP-grasp domain-containing protein n=1 Tax=Mesobacillus subterraneus TaxID=285983 RepID=UPI00203A987E|nr:ATP-grasp domain-containing protein [Mesobacillus subterraneus]MCM3666377.1 ATP-grasp domain-containing protein [Mesobacillus subterraneus]MCM3685351.1 ATP-grasp domain-containing protein [Mesobacillus subterraneus]